MYASERQQRILTQARERGRIEVSEVSEEFKVAPETVRRDLAALERKGVLKRVHGGAIPLVRLGFEPSIADRLGAESAEKSRIAHAALDELPSGGSVAFDAGTTVAQLVDLLPQSCNLTVITHAPALVPALSARPDLTLHFVGGEIRARTLAAVGEWAERAYSEVSIDVAFIGTNALTVAYGLNAPDLRESAVKQAMVKSARRVVVLADHTKLGRTDFGRICSLSDVDTLITDSGSDPEVIEEIRAAGVEVRIA